jgi:hypothetical protein
MTTIIAVSLERIELFGEVTCLIPSLQHVTVAREMNHAVRAQLERLLPFSGTIDHASVVVAEDGHARSIATFPLVG